MHSLLEKIETIKEEDKDLDNRKIADFLLENFREINDLNITKIASTCNVSPTKITRFSDKLDLKGFSELKLRLSDIAETVIIDGEYINLSKSVIEKNNSFFNDYFQVLSKSIEKQFNYLNEIEIDPIINKLINSKKVYVFAFNLSYNVSKNFVQRLEWFGVNVIIESDIISIETYMNLITKEDMVILISISGKNEWIQKIAKRLKKIPYVLGVGDSLCNFKNDFNYFISLFSEETKLWNINSIKSQLVVQSLDFIQINFILQSKNK